MSTTSHGHPYPDPDDYVIDGDDAIKALAQFLNVGAEGYAPVAAIASGVSGAGVWNAGLSTLSAEFTLGAGAYGAGTALIYTGPTRYFAFDLRVDWQAGMALGRRDTQLVVNGNADLERVYQYAETLTTAISPHVAGLVRLDSGDELEVLVGHNSAGGPWVAGARLHLRGL